MKNKNNILVLSFACSIILFSCKKETVDEVDFDVTTAAKTYSLKDSVFFKMSGNPDVISFYSGEIGNNYEFRNRTSKEGGTFNFSFQSRGETLPCFDAISSGAFKVLASQNFKGTYSGTPSVDSAALNSATWTDITSRFYLPSSSVGAAGINVFYNSNEVDLIDLVKTPSDPIYIAFKYAAPTTPVLGPNGITIGSLSLYSSFPDGSINTFNVVPGSSASTTWKIINAANPTNAWITSTSYLKFPNVTATTAYSEEWIVSNAFYPKTATPDKGVPIKNISNAPVQKLAYKFSKVGTYNITFVASNNRDYGRKELVKQISLTITP